MNKLFFLLTIFVLNAFVYAKTYDQNFAIQNTNEIELKKSFPEKSTNKSVILEKLGPPSLKDIDFNGNQIWCYTNTTLQNHLDFFKSAKVAQEVFIIVFSKNEDTISKITHSNSLGYKKHLNKKIVFEPIQNTYIKNISKKCTLIVIMRL